ncbi:MAG: endonuclease, partial [Desulfobulbaceae bacterium]|nr:endonuclease [Desulfobulbaceae bacterium]
MRFLLYNIRYGAGVGVNFHFPVPYAGYLKRSTHNINRIVNFIKSLSPDIIGLIEVDSGSYRTEKMCQAELIARDLGHYCVVETKYGAGSMAHSMPILNKQGNGVLTNREIISHEYHYLAEGVKRLVIEVRLEDFTVFLVHLSLTYRKRQYQLEQLHRIVSKVKGP